MLADAATSSPFNAQVLELSPVMLISLSSSSVGRLPSAARSSTVHPLGTLMLRSRDPVCGYVSLVVISTATAPLSVSLPIAKSIAPCRSE